MCPDTENKEIYAMLKEIDVRFRIECSPPLTASRPGEQVDNNSDNAAP